MIFFLDFILLFDNMLFMCVHLFATDDVLRLRTVMDATMCHIHGAAMLYKLAQETLKMATLSDRPRHMPLLNAAFELGLKVRSWHHHLVM